MKSGEKSEHQIAIENQAFDAWQVCGWRIYYDAAMCEGWFDEVGMKKMEAVFYGNAVELIRYISLKNGRVT